MGSHGRSPGIYDVFVGSLTKDITKKISYSCFSSSLSQLILTNKNKKIPKFYNFWDFILLRNLINLL